MITLILKNYLCAFLVTTDGRTRNKVFCVTHLSFYHLRTKYKGMWCFHFVYPSAGGRGYPVHWFSVSGPRSFPRVGEGHPSLWSEVSSRGLGVPQCLVPDTFWGRGREGPQQGYPPIPLPFRAPPSPWPWWGQRHPSHSPLRTKTGVSPPPILIWPGGGVPTLDAGRIPTLGYPPSWPGWGDGVSTLDRGWGTYLGWGRGTYLGVPPILTWLGGGGIYLGQEGIYLGVPPPPGCAQTGTCENSTFPSYYVRGR